MTAIRYFALLVVPSIFAVLLSFADKPDTATALKTDAFLSALLSGDEQNAQAQLTKFISDIEVKLEVALADPERKHFKRLAWLENLAILSIIGGFCLLALIISPKLSPLSKVNALTALAVGYCIAKITVGFQYIDWVEFLNWALLGFSGAFLVVVFRGYLQNMNWRGSR